MRRSRRSLAFALLVACVAIAPRPASTAPSDSLAATSAPPWNPPRAIPASDPWEAVVRFPGRLVSLPLAALGLATRVSLLAAEQGFYVQRFLYFFRGVPVPFAIGPAGLGDRTGLGAGVEISPPLGPVHMDALFDASLKKYTRARVRLSEGWALAEYRIDQRPGERFFGLGMGTHEEDASRYGLHQERAVLGIDAATEKMGPGGARENLVAWVGPRWSRTTQGYDADEPSIAKSFPEAVATTLDRQIEHFTYGARLRLNYREGKPHWTHGWQLIAEAERYDRPFVESPARTGTQFNRYSYLAETGFSLGRDPRTLRFTWTTVDNDLRHDADRFLVSDLARIGGANGLAGYEPHRFHELDATNLRAAYVFPLAQHFELDLHTDLGAAFHDWTRDLRPNRLKQSIGIGLRGRTNAAVITTLGFDVSHEAARFVFSMGPER